jgi:transglutaminase-like putative cysteine protease
MRYGGAIPAEVLPIASGEAGVRATLKHMVKIARQYKTHPLVRELARRVVQPCKSGDQAAEAAALQSYVQQRIRYVADVWDVETLQSPVITLGYREPSFGAYMPGGVASGDCDDQSVALAALLLSIGIPGCFVAVGMDGGPFSHVLTQAQLRERTQVRYIPLETIIPAAPGWFPPETTEAMIAHFG